MPKIAKYAFSLVFVAAFFLFSLSASLAVVINCRAFYGYGFREFGVSQDTGISPDQLNLAARGLISYFNSSQEYISVTVIKDGAPFTLFNQREVLHLKDVKGLIRLDYTILIFSSLMVGGAAVLLVIRRDYRFLARPLLWGGALTLAVIFFITILAVTNFNTLFIDFHLISFSNDFWQLDPATDYLIRLFPEQFFEQAAALVGAGTGIFAAAGVLGGWRLLKKNP